MTMTDTLPRAAAPRDTGWSVVRENLAAIIGFLLLLASIVLVVLLASGIVTFTVTAAVLIITVGYTSALRT